MFKVTKTAIVSILLSFTLLSAAPVMSWIPPYSPARENAQAQLETARVQNGLSHVALQFWEPNGGNVQKDKYNTSDAQIIEIRDTAQAHGIKAMLCVYNGDDGWNWSQATNAIVNNKASFINALITEMNRLNLDGIEIDLEGPNVTSVTDGNNFISFISDLSAAMPAGKDLTVASFHSEYHTPGPRHWDALLPLVDALTTMGYAEIGMNGSDPAPISMFDPTYAGQKALASADPSKFMIGMPGWVGTWEGNTAQQQVDWVKSDGVVGMAIWDLELAHSSWKTDAIWASINQIRGDVVVGTPTVTITGGPSGTTTDQTPTFTWSGSDPGGSISKYYYSIDDATPNNQTTGTSYTSTTLSLGNHTFYIQAEDNEGNLSEVVSQGFYVSDGSAGPNLITNGDFSSGATDWTWYAHDYSPVFATGTGTATGGQFVMQMTSPGTELWHGQLTQNGINLENGKTYEVSFDAKASSSRTIGWSLEKDVTWDTYGSGEFSITTSMTNYSTTFTMSAATDANALFNISAGASTASVTVDNISVREVTLSGTTYTITASAGANGSISPSGSVTVNENASQTFSITPTGGYEVDDVLVGGVSQGAITSYTFSNVTTDKTISASFKALPVGSVNFPFPQQLSYGTKPSVAQTTMDATIQTRYEYWKAAYLKQSGSNYYIEARSTDGSTWANTVSEAHGYGMMIFAIMAGYDDNAKAYFDGMVGFYENYKRANSLMDWKVWSDWSSENGSATDGDLDIAYALILAYKQWGDVTYLTKAQAMIESIWVNEMYNTSNLLTTPGDSWWSGTTYQWDSYTRPSDWMAGHFRVFDDHSTRNWSAAADSLYKFYNAKAHASTGLVPDFFKGDWPAPANEIEGQWDGEYSYNACRVPLRFAMDYATSQSSDANTALDKIGNWINSSSGGNASSVYSGYYLDGSVLAGAFYQDASFIGPFGAGLIATPHSGLMTNIWNMLKEDYMYESGGVPYDNSYGNSLGILSMLVMSGNWWNPSSVTPTTHTITATMNGTGTLTPSGATTVSDGGSQSYAISANAGSQIDSIKINGSKIPVTTSYTFNGVTSNQTIEVWASTIPVLTYTITASSGANGSISPTGVATVNAGSNNTYTFTPNTGYEVDDIKVNGASVGSGSSYQISNIAANTTIAVTFKIKTYTITVTAGANGSITPGSAVTLNYNGSQSFSISANAGYEIDDVKVDGISQGAVTSYDFTSVTGDRSIEATFKAITHTINSSVVGNGSITPLGATTVSNNGSQSYTIAAEDAFASIDSVFVNGVNQGAITSYTFSNVTGDQTIVAYTSRGNCDADAWASESRYALDAIVSHNGEEWISTRKNNSSEPGTFNWTSLGACDVYVPTVTTQVTTNHLIGVVDVTVRDTATVVPQTDTTVTVYNLEITTDTTEVQTDTLWDGVYHSSSFDTTGIQIDTVTTITGTEILPYVPTVVVTPRDSVKTHKVNVTLIDSTPTGVVDKEDTVVVTSVVDSTFDSTWTITETFTDGVLTNSSTAFTRVDTIVDTISSTSVTLPYQPTIVVTPRDSSKSVTTTTTLIDSTPTGTVGKEDTVVVTTVVDSTFDSTWTITETFTDGVVTNSSTALISADTTVDTVSSTSVTLSYQPTLTEEITTSHLVDTVQSQLIDSSVNANLDTIVTTTLLDIITDTTVLQIDSLADDVLFKTVYDTTNIVVDTVETGFTLDTLPYSGGAITIIRDTTTTPIFEYPTVVDSAVQPNLDTVVTTSNLEITVQTTVERTRTYEDVTLMNTLYDTIEVIRDTVVLSSSSDTLIYFGNSNEKPVISIIPDTSHYTNANFLYQVNVTDSDVGESFTYRVEDGPAGITISTGGQIIWLADTLAVLDSYLTTVIVTDSKGASDTTDFYLTLEIDPATPAIPHATTSQPVRMWPTIVRSNNDFVVVELPDEDTYRLRIFSHTGDKVLDREGRCSEGEIRWTVPMHLTSGKYLVVLETESFSGRQSVRRSGLGIQR